MAQLDIQAKRGLSWIWWIVGLIVLALIIWWFVAGRNRSTTVADVAAPAVATGAMAAATTDTMAGSGMANTGGAVTDLSMLAGATTIGDLAGRAVILRNAPVARVVSDKGFWAGTGTGPHQAVFVVRGNQNASYTAPNGAVDAGKQVNVYGTVQAMPGDLTQQTTSWNLGSADKQMLGGQPLYVSADSVRIATP